MGGYEMSEKLHPFDLYCVSCGMPLIEATAKINALQAKLDVAVEAMQECVDNYSTEAKFVMKLRLETTIAKLEGK
jgi:nucleoside recognition membrane protein YjiH